MTTELIAFLIVSAIAVVKFTFCWHPEVKDEDGKQR